MCYASAAATGSLYATTAERVAAAESINASSALVALYGPILDVHSLGEVAMTKTTVTYGVLVMALCIALVRRHTRVEEESGRAELLGALGVEPAAPLLSAVLRRGDRRRSSSRSSPALADIAGGPAGRRVAVVRGLVARPRAGRHRDRRGRRPAVGQRPHLRRDRRRRRRRASSCCGPSATRPSPGSAGSRRSAGRPSCAPGPTPAGGCSCSTWRSPSSSSAPPSPSARRRDLGVGPDRRASRPGHRLAAAGRRAGAQPPRARHLARGVDASPAR